MLGLAKFLSLFPFTVNVFGKKRDLIVGLGNLIYSEKKLAHLNINGHVLDFSESDYFKVFAYATNNFIDDFKTSDLGYYMMSNLSKSKNFIDVGANLGGYSFLAKELGYRVVLFEPLPELGKILLKNSAAFGQVHNMALSDESGFMTFYTSSKNIGGSSLVEVKDSEISGYDGKVQVKVERFDTVFKKEISDDRLFDLIKVDVEGNEFKTVKGMKGALEKGLISAIWCEVRGMNSDRNAGSYLTVCRFLSDYGLVPYLYNQGQKSIFDYENVENCPQFFDLLFLKDE